MKRFGLVAVLVITCATSFCQLYWVEGTEPGRIKSYNFELEEVSVIHEDLNGPVDLQIIEEPEFMLWSDTSDHRIYMSNLDGTDMDVFINEMFYWPFHFDLDEENERIFFTQVQSGIALMVDLYDGTTDTIYSSSDPLIGIAIDPGNDVVGITTGGGELVLVDLAAETTEVIPFISFDPLYEPESGEIKFREGQANGFYFILDGKISQLDIEDQPEQMTVNSEWYSSFIHHPTTDRMFCTSFDSDIIKEHEQLMSGTNDFFELQGEIFLYANRPLGIDIFGEIPASIGIEPTFDILIFPNPVEAELVIESPKNILSVQFYDSTGRMVKNYMIAPNRRHEVDIGEFESGIYFSVIETELGVTTQKVFKR